MSRRSESELSSLLFLFIFFLLLLLLFHFFFFFLGIHLSMFLGRLFGPGVI
jgi:hypothetical protein